MFAEMGIRFVTFQTLQLSPQLDDRKLWILCQRDGWVLLTDNRNDEGIDSLQATLADSWQPGALPVLTLSSKNRLEQNPDFADRVATDIAELLFGIIDMEYRYQPRIFIPRPLT